MTFQEWCARWNVGARALQELNDIVTPTPTHTVSPGSEAAVQATVRLEAARKGIYLWRNNRGAGVLENGSYLRWGLANDSKEVGKVIKSADLIGIRKHVVTAYDVGSTLGVFVSREIKHANWHPIASDTDYPPQLKWAALIQSMGGDAQIVTGPGSL